nr:MAG TPA: hypothetical protein [Caudoviricetes sp.]DAY17718.1 MAG TPA: hypothetical protein [Caudoviricetes sp.]
MYQIIQNKSLSRSNHEFDSRWSHKLQTSYLCGL